VLGDQSEGEIVVELATLHQTASPPFPWPLRPH
jgi:hypothetical protein